jgi:hypothetical protein
MSVFLPLLYIYYTTFFVVCQGVFQKFLKNFFKVAADRFSSLTNSRVTVILALDDIIISLLHRKVNSFFEIKLDDIRLTIRGA